MIRPGSSDHAANEVAHDLLMDRWPSTMRITTRLGRLEHLRNNLTCKLFPGVMCGRSRHITPPLPNGRETPDLVHQEAGWSAVKQLTRLICGGWRKRVSPVFAICPLADTVGVPHADAGERHRADQPLSAPQSNVGRPRASPHSAISCTQRVPEVVARSPLCCARSRKYPGPSV